MEFLDDLLNQPEPEEEPPDEQDSGPRAGQEPVAPSTYPVATDEEAWADLLEGVDYEEPEPLEEPRGRRSHRRLGALSTGQKVTLGVLGTIVVGLWLVLLLTMRRSLSEGGRPPSPDGAGQTTTEMEAATGEPTLTSEIEGSVGEPAETATPAVTPSPAPPVATAYDIQIHENPDDIELYLRRGDQYIELGAYEAALTDFKRVQELDDARVEAYIGEGWASFYSGRWQRAEEAFNSAINLQETVGEAYFGLGHLAFYRGDYEGAASQFDQAAEVDRTNAAAEAWLGIAAAKLDDGQEAFGAVTRAMSQTTELPIVYVAQSWARRTEDPPDIDGAQADLLYAQELAPNSFLTLNALAQFYVDYRPERLAEAEQLATYAEDWATNDIQRAVALQTLGEIYLAQTRNADAERAFLRAADLVTQDGEILLVGLEEDLDRARE